MAKIRGRENYTVSTGSDNFEVRLGDSLAFWKDNIVSRLRTDGVAKNAQDITILSGSSYFGIGDLSIWPLDAEVPFFDLYQASSSVNVAQQQAFDPFYFSPLGPSGAPPVGP